jgi:hypothetical protein
MFLIGIESFTASSSFSRSRSSGSSSSSSSGGWSSSKSYSSTSYRSYKQERNRQLESCMDFKNAYNIRLERKFLNSCITDMQKSAVPRMYIRKRLVISNRFLDCFDILF